MLNERAVTNSQEDFSTISNLSIDSFLTKLSLLEVFNFEREEYKRVLENGDKDELEKLVNAFYTAVRRSSELSHYNYTSIEDSNMCRIVLLLHTYFNALELKFMLKYYFNKEIPSTLDKFLRESKDVLKNRIEVYVNTLLSPDKNNLESPNRMITRIQEELDIESGVEIVVENPLNKFFSIFNELKIDYLLKFIEVTIPYDMIEDQESLEKALIRKSE